MNTTACRLGQYERSLQPPAKELHGTAIAYDARGQFY